MPCTVNSPAAMMSRCDWAHMHLTVGEVQAKEALPVLNGKHYMKQQMQCWRL